jgi:hypothetical protein
MNSLMRDRLIVGGKMGMLLVTATLLMATSPPPDCDHAAAPVVFHAAGTCGPGGLIVVETQAGSSTVALANVAALGLPALRNSGRYLSQACPFTVEKGEWQFEWTCDPAATGGGDDGGGGDGGGDGLVAAADGGAGRDGGAGGGLPMSCLRRCVAHLGANGDLLFTCTDSLGELLCESRLTKVVLP